MGGLAACLALAPIALSACFAPRALAPPPAPPAVLPAVTLPATPPPPGSARVVLDVVDGPTDVSFEHVTDGHPTWQRACTTPCVVDLAPGTVAASFLRGERGDAATLAIAPGTTVYRRRLRRHHRSMPLLVAGYAVGFGGIEVLLTSFELVALHALSPRFPDVPFDPIEAVVGAGMMAAGGTLLYFGWPTDRPAAVTQFALPPR